MSRRETPQLFSAGMTTFIQVPSDRARSLHTYLCSSEANSNCAGQETPVLGDLGEGHLRKSGLVALSQVNAEI